MFCGNSDEKQRGAGERQTVGELKREIKEERKRTREKVKQKEK